MRLTFFALVTGIVAGWAGGGRIGALGRAPLRAWWLLVGAIPLYIVTGRSEDLRYGYTLFVASLVCVLLFLLGNARRLPALLLVAVGLALNLTVIALNHGMPYSIDALHRSGVAERTPQRLFRATVQSHPIRDGDRLVALSDRISLEPLRELLSIGDIVMAFGLGLAAYSAMLRFDQGTRGLHARRRRENRPSRDPVPITATAPTTAANANAMHAPDIPVLDLTAYDDELLAFDPSIALDPSLRTEANEALTLIRLLARTPELTITDELFRARERLRILGASQVDTPTLADLTREALAKDPPARVRVRPTGITVGGSARPVPPVPGRGKTVIDLGGIDLFGEQVGERRPDAPH